MNKIILILSIVLLIGCAAQQKKVVWNNPDKIKSEFIEDRAQCTMYARQMQSQKENSVMNSTSDDFAGAIAGAMGAAFYGNQEFNDSFRECMELKGYVSMEVE